MPHYAKILIAASTPAFVITGALLAESPSAPATQPATQPSTQPAPGNVADANAPLVIPDGTSRENPGPAAPRDIWLDDQGGRRVVKGVRG